MTCAWDTCRPGDPAIRQDGLICGARSEPVGRDRAFFICTRSGGHPGRHVAVGVMLVLAMWDDEAPPQVAGIPQASPGGTP